MMLILAPTTYQILFDKTRNTMVFSRRFSESDGDVRIHIHRMGEAFRPRRRGGKH